MDIFGLFISALWQQKFSNFIKNWTRIKFYKNEDEYILKYLSVFFAILRLMQEFKEKWSDFQFLTESKTIYQSVFDE